MEPSEERSGSMVLRAWLEDGQPDRLRVRIFSTIGSQQAKPLSASSAGAVLAAVQAWLENLADQAR
ncbi:hypothetical protein [Actinophytocola sp.]|uniref:hypothetical protein n=1 Tax=Actinophytocola sp. TaxID=1872138 RepID=UPI002ED223A7